MFRLRQPALVSSELGADVALAVESLSKRYRVGRSRAARGATAIAAATDVDDDELDEEEVEPEEPGRPTGERWALRDVSFKLHTGTGLGVVGPVGSGKTTLVKVLAGVTPPTSGRAVVRGRVVPLLPHISSLVQGDASGRKNVFLIASFLGIPSDVAASRMGDIMRFAELEHHADDKLDHYSSGLQRRLAAAVALNLEPDVLLAEDGSFAGDASFRERCLRRIEQLLEEGASLVLGTDDLDLARRLCRETIWLDEGRVVAHGLTEHVLGAYERAFGIGAPDLAQLSRGQQPSLRTSRDDRLAGFNEHVALHTGYVTSDAGEPVSTVAAGSPVSIVIELEVATPGTQITCGVIAEAGAARMKVAQPEPFTAEHEGTYRVTARLIQGFPSVGTFSGIIGAVIRHERAESRLHRTGVFACRVVEAESPPIEAPDEDQQAPSWSVEFEGRRIYPAVGAQPPS